MARKPKVYKDDDWTDDYFTRHKTEYKRKPKVQNPVEEDKLLHPVVPSSKPQSSPFIPDPIKKVTKALEVSKADVDDTDQTIQYI
jgi:hypothetical protein